MQSVTGIAAMMAAQSNTASTTPQPRLVHAAHEFEAQMMKELLKPMTASNGLDGQEGDTASGSSGALGQFATEALAQGISQQGGFGVATSIIHQLSHSGTKQVTSTVTGE